MIGFLGGSVPGRSNEDRGARSAICSFRSSRKNPDSATRFVAPPRRRHVAVTDATSRGTRQGRTNNFLDPHTSAVAWLGDPQVHDQTLSRLMPDVGAGALRCGRGGPVHRRGPGNGPRHPHFHDAAGVSSSRDAVSGIDAGGVPVLSGEHGRIKPWLINEMVGSRCRSLGRSA